MTILCIGDSNTNGYDPSSFIGESYPEGIRWIDRLGDAAVINFGINGITIPGDHSVYTDLIRRKDPDLVIVMLGTNGILEGATAGNTVRKMEDLLSDLRQMKKPILLIAPPALKEGEGVPMNRMITESKELGALYKEAAERNACQFADAGNWDIDLAFDGVHFSEEGHAEFARQVCRILGL